MGNYKFDGIEYAGSHSGTDIRLPLNTPIYAIGDGKVVKAMKSSVGFGNHVVIQHDNVPSFEDPDILTTYYSSYNHLSDFLVQPGDVVTKGQNIGFSGQSGASSLPHLHFQIDNDLAPWHPYWPFSFQEAAKAGYTYNQAVSAGLNKDKAVAVTINPLLYIQKYSGFSPVLRGSALKSKIVPELPKAVQLRQERNFFGKGF
jgi:murein DD-endopeptidase MepM/ murein hydrolase activator NlpD